MYVLFCIAFLDALGFGLIVPLLPIFKNIYNLNALNIGFLASAFFLAQFFGSIIIGYLSDKNGRRKTLLIALTISVSSYLLTGLSEYYIHSFLLLLILRTISGFFAGNVAIIFASVANLSTKDNMLQNISFLGSGFTLGFILGPTFGAFLANNFGHSIVFFSTALFFFSCLVIIFLFFKEPNYYDDIANENIIMALKNTFTNKGALTFIGLFVLLAFAISSLEIFLITHTLSIKLHQSTSMLGFIWTYFAIILSITQIFICKYIPSKIAVPTGFIIWFFIFLALSFVENLIGIFVIVTFLGISSALLFTNITSNLALNGSARQQGIIFGVNFAADAVGGIFGPIILSAIYFAIPSLPLIWFILSVLSFIATIISYRYFIKNS